jgi:hypothetical protein
MEAGTALNGPVPPLSGRLAELQPTALKLASYLGVGTAVLTAVETGPTPDVPYVVLRLPAQTWQRR